MSEDFTPNYTFNTHEESRKFIERFRNSDVTEIDSIITRYKSFKIELTEAALYIAVEKGIIPFSLKEKLTEQIRFNMSDAPKEGKQVRWEKSNAFKEYAARYSDDDLYRIIDDPSEIMIDTYHGILQAALERELITQEDFDTTYKTMLRSTRTDAEIDEEISDELVEDLGIFAPVEAEENPKDKDAPEKLFQRFRPVRTGLLLFVAAGLIILREALRRHPFHDWFDYISLFFAGLFVIPGIILIVYGIFFKKNK